ncbi:hypothetical protein NOVOSPHI9U_420297 [Novosphingobium sp. 9U]|nr:hypothetical protein NOVOSPHI9U_420297 [Novosphingobium sp. 9U]
MRMEKARLFSLSALLSRLNQSRAQQLLLTRSLNVPSDSQKLKLGK